MGCGSVMRRGGYNAGLSMAIIQFQIHVLSLGNFIHSALPQFTQLHTRVPAYMSTMQHGSRQIGNIESDRPRNHWQEMKKHSGHPCEERNICGIRPTSDTRDFQN